MSIYNTAKDCPSNALTKIQAGRLRGKSDINPMWRIKKLTELFGPCGIGWYYDIVQQWTEKGAKDEISAFCNIALYIKFENEWSKPIYGTGGSAFVALESKGLYTSDECFKMALTDALSVACKALGIAADVYWEADKLSSKYQSNAEIQTPTKINKTQIKEIDEKITKTKSDKIKLLEYYKVSKIEDLSYNQAEHCLKILASKEKDVL